MTSLLIFVYSYKNKNLQAIIDNIYDTTAGDFSVAIADQNPIDRGHVFKSYKNMTYRHVYWDFLYGPLQFKQEYTMNKDYDHYAIISDDVVFDKNWNVRVLDFIADRDKIIVSGNALTKISQEDYFYLTAERQPSLGFELANYIDRNFIFYSHKILEDVRFPNFLKYNGEEEYTSLKAYCLGYDIFCAPESLYRDNSLRTMDNLYVPFSKNHGYNKFLRDFKAGNITDLHRKQDRSVDSFCNFHGIDRDKIYLLPFNDDDVAYDPNKLEIDTNHDVGNRRFLANLKGIF